MLRYKIVLCIVVSVFLCSCALIGSLFSPDLYGEVTDRFYAATNHQLLKILSKQNRLGYIFERGFFTKKVWGGKVVSQAIGQNIELTYERKDFDKLKLFLGDDLSVGPGLENVHYIVLKLEDIKRYELVDYQPLMEYMGKDQLDTLEKPFVVSMLKVSKFSIEAYKKTEGQFGAVYSPYPMVKIKGGTGISSERKEGQVGYNVFVGYKLFQGNTWIRHFQDMPKIKVWILSPKENVVVNRVRLRVKGSIPDYSQLAEEHKNRLRVYIMTRNEYQDNWILQTKARIDTKGRLEGIVKLGSLEKGNGHRYSVAVFATYFDINREVNSKIPFLPFNKGKFIVNVKRLDDF